MSRFVAAGEVNDDSSPKDDEWARAEQRIKDSKQQRFDTGHKEEGKSLYEVLQANKAAKQEAYEESIKLKNQFRNLDDDEVDFLDAVLESTRAKDATVKKETLEQLDLFKKQQEEANKRALEADETGEPTPKDEWSVAKKRKRQAKTDSLLGVKVRRKSSSAKDQHVPLANSESPCQKSSYVSEDSSTQSTALSPEPAKTENEASQTVTSPTQSQQTPSVGVTAPGLGLVAYDSDDD